jgi:hypothetical protein
LWIEEKFQPNVEIAGSPRNALRCSHAAAEMEVEHWMGSGPSAGYQPQSNCEDHLQSGRE